MKLGHLYPVRNGLPMEIPAQRQNQLRILFAALPARTLAQLQTAFEHGRASNDGLLPYDQLIALLPGHKPPLDLVQVFHPASLLVSDRDDRPDQLPMSMLQTLWQAYCTDAVIDADASHDDPAQVRHGLSLWLQDAWEAEGGSFRFKEILGRKNGTKVPMIISLLTFGEEISHLIADWPEEICDLGDDILVPLRDLHDLLIDVDCNITPWLMFLLYARLRRPQEILRAVHMITRQTSDMMLLMTNMKILPDVMLGEAEELLMHIAEPMKSFEEEAHLDAMLRRFAGIVFGSGEEFDIRPHAQWGKSLSALAGQSQQIWKRKLDNCVTMLEQVTPRNRLKSFLGGEITAARTSDHLNTSIVSTVELALNEFRIAFSFASRLGISSLRDKYIRKIEGRINEQVDNLIDLMADPGEVDPAILREHFAAMVRFTRAFRGKAEADILQRRGVAIAA